MGRGEGVGSCESVTGAAGGDRLEGCSPSGERGGGLGWGWTRDGRWRG